MRTVSFTVRGIPAIQPRQQFRAMVPSAADCRALFEQATHGFLDNATLDATWADFRKKLVWETKAQAYYSEERMAKTTAWKTAVRRDWNHTGERPFDGPVSISVVVFLTRPKAKTRKTKPNPREWDTRKTGIGGDVDNFLKSIMDALSHEKRKDGSVEEYRAWDDDSSVVVVSAVKLMCAAEEEEHAEITITELAEDAGLVARVLKFFGLFGTFTK